MRQSPLTDGGGGGAGAPAADRYGKETPIDVAQIERELHALWKGAAEESASSGSGPVVRACSMNLVAPCTNDVQFQHVAAVLETVALRFPCRAILVKIDLDEREPRLEARASTLCSLGGHGERRVCHEQIQVHASIASSRVVVPTVLGLLVPDVPAYVWSPCEKLLSMEIVRELAYSADALILDSHRFSDPFGALRTALTIAGDHPDNRARAGSSRPADVGPGFGILDLEWYRQGPWRAAIAHAFDGGAARALAGEIDRVRIEFARDASAPTRARDVSPAALLGGWIASRLRWSRAQAVPRRDGGSRELAFDSGGPRTLTLTPRNASGRPGALLRVECSSPHGAVRLRREPGADWCVIAVESHSVKSDDAAERVPPGRETTARVSAGSDDLALLLALTTVPRDLEFEGALEAALAFH